MLREQTTRAHHLRRRVERQALLGSPAVRCGSGGRLDWSRRANPVEHLGLALLFAEARIAARDAGGRRDEISRARRFREPDRRQRQSGIRWLQLRATSRRQNHRAGQVVRGRPGLLRYGIAGGRYPPPG